MARSSVMLPRGGANDFDSDAQPETAPSDASEATAASAIARTLRRGRGRGCCGD
ncbi:hypothetical protein D3C81_813590 [compost metagenome]